MTINLDEIEMPSAPEILHQFGVPGKQAFRRINQELESGADNLEVIRDYAKGEERFAEYVAETENAETEQYGIVLGECEAEKEADEAAKKAALEKIEKDFADKETAREKRIEEAKNAVLATADNLDLPTAEDRADAVVGWDLAKASLEDFKRRAIKSLQNRKVKNPDYDPEVKNEKGEPVGSEYVDVEALLNTITFPEIGVSLKQSGAPRGQGGWKPRWSGAIVDGKELPAAQSAFVAKHIGVTVDALLNSLQRMHSRDTVDSAAEGKPFEFTVSVTNVDNGESTVHAVTLLKG